MKMVGEKLRFPSEVLQSRIDRLKDILIKRNLDAAVIRTLSSFIYFTGVKWLRPSLIVPVDGDPVVFLAKGEEELFRKYSIIKEIEAFVEGGELMGKVSRYLRELGVRRVGMDFELERDSFILFYMIFRNLNPTVEIHDLSEDIMNLRMIKDDIEISYIKAAAQKAKEAIDYIKTQIKPGMSETEIAAELYNQLYKLGSEEPLVYINAGPHPRVHSEPLSTEKVRSNSIVTIVVGADHYRYYANKSVTILIGNPPEIARRAYKAMEEAQEVAVTQSKTGRKFIEVMKEIDKVFSNHDVIKYRVVGYTHGVGLQVEETPITTIVPKHRFMEIKERMVLAMIHSPILIPGVGQVKIEDTVLVSEDSCNKLT